MSHHLDTPLAAQTGQLYLDDLYVFPGDGSTVLVMDVNSNVNGLHSEPGFHPEARYEFKVHFDGADFEDLTYRVSFGEPDAEGRQALQVHALTGDRPARTRRPASWCWRAGPARRPARGGTRMWAGRIADSFYIDLSLLAIINGAVANGTAVDLSGWRPDEAKNSFAGTTVESIVLEMPHAASAAAARRPHRRVVRHQTGHRRRRLAADQPGRAPDDVADLLARRHRLHQPGQHPAPVRGRHAAAKYIGEQVAAVVAATGTTGDPAGLRPDRGPGAVPRRAALPGRHPGGLQLRRVQRPDPGRQRPEAMLSLVAGTAVPSGLQPSGTAQQRSSDFPYVVPA